jgi:excinuclease ABC subunit A
VPDPLTDSIRLHGCRQHNLRNLDLDIPLGKLTVVTGPSGSGKSSLAFHTLYAEGQRRYVETFSPYVRQFFDRMDKPDVDAIEGIPPAIAIAQGNQIRTTRSTVGTLTEINDYLKLLYPRLATAHDPQTGEAIQPDSPESAAAWTLKNLARKTVLITFPITVPPGTPVAELFPFLNAQGYLRVLIGGNLVRTDDPPPPGLLSPDACVLILQDRLNITQASRSRLLEALEAAFHLGKGSASVIEHASSDVAGQCPAIRRDFTSNWTNPRTGFTLRAPTPALFSFNSPLGACPACRGFGRIIGIDLEKAVPDASLSIARGAIKPFQGERGGECQRDLVRCCRENGVDVRTAWEDLTREEREWILYGDGRAATHNTPPDMEALEALWQSGQWYGVKGFFDWLETKAYKMHVRVFLSRYRSQTTCPACRGRRLQPEALCFKIEGKSLPDLCALPVSELLPWFTNLQSRTTHAKPGMPAAHQADTTLRLVLAEIHSRLSYLAQVGLDYLTLDRPARTLSGGEVERVNLTTCLGASLTGTLFVLDEPTVGLHARDVARLIGVLHSLRDKGNTLVVVEHENAVMQAADHLVDLGPGAGQHGGEIIYQGPVTVMGGKPGSGKKSGAAAAGATGHPPGTLPWLSGARAIKVPATRRKPGKAFLRIRGATRHNLRKLDADIPLGRFVCLTGVSGSGKSTFAHDVVYQNLARKLGAETHGEAAPLREMTGHQHLASVEMVDQSAVARTPRSTPAVFLGAFDFIRQLFCDTESAMAAGLKPGFFSFNSGDGRCDRCAGNGFEKVDMQFLSDLYVTCPDCDGRRYKSSTLDHRWNGRSIADVLDLTAEQAVTVFFNSRIKDDKKEQRLFREIRTCLQPLLDVGLGYLRLGQPLNTLSGGESQRLKLCQLLQASGTRDGRLLILDEPTTGLHFSDIERLLAVFNQLVDSGHSLLVIEHHFDVIKSADWIIDLGPEAGEHGGQIIAQGTPEEIATHDTATGTWLAKALAAAPSRAGHAAKRPARARRPATTHAEPHISLKGARHHNLKNISLELPHGRFVVISGLSGSGKSTLAFDILFAEGQRRFLDSMSAYARQFAGQLEKPEIDILHGLPPTVAIEQRVSQGGGKSTVATVTEIWNFIRLLYSKLGILCCPDCQVPVEKQSIAAIEKTIRSHLKKGAVSLLAPVIRGRKGYHTEVAAWALKQGFPRLLVDGRFLNSEGFTRLERFSEHDIDVLVAELPPSTSANHQQAITRTLEIGKGTMRILTADQKFVILSTLSACPSCSRSFDEPDPRLFSFNSPHGWCPECRGYGRIPKQQRRLDTSAFDSMLEAELDADRAIERMEDEDLVTCPACNGSRLNPTAANVRLAGRASGLPRKTGARPAAAAGKAAGNTNSHNKARTVQSHISNMRYVGSGAAAGAGSGADSGAVAGALAGDAPLAVADLARMTVSRAAAYFSKLGFTDPRQQLIARDILPEIRQRLEFLEEVGLGYLQLDRSGNTLSGGESQRIRLAAQLGSNLRGVLYVLDEPTIGLHPRDNAALLATLIKLRDHGNSLVVVEHDEDTIAAADHLIDLGPGAGRLGGEVVYQGRPPSLMAPGKAMRRALTAHPGSPTLRAFASPLSHPTRGGRRPVSASHPMLVLNGCRANNLKDVTAAIPLGRLTVLTGISGSGKSTLMHECLAVAAAASRRKSRGKNPPFTGATGFEHIKSFHEVDQSPIGKTSRSCPATYIKVFDHIRALFAQLPESRMRGFNASRFSFNTEGGRCPGCKGNGRVKLEMDFLPSAWVHCESCNGGRYNPATLEATFHGRHIAGVLAMTIDEAAAFFESQPRIAAPLRLMADTGLGYLQLGQPSSTLSGGEAQRIKLVSELIKGRGAKDQIRYARSAIHNLYLIEEPTVGLHHEDIRRLIDILHRLVDEGHTVVVIEHHMAVAAEADWILDLGPEAGEAGGRIVAHGPPEKIITCKSSRTAPFLKAALGR